MFILVFLEKKLAEAAAKAEERLRQVRHAHAVTNELLLERAIKAQRVRDGSVTESPFKPGDRVLIRHGSWQKLKPHWFEPYKVIKAHPAGDYAVAEARTRVMTNPVNGSRLVKAAMDGPIGLWTSSVWTRYLKRHGITIHDPHELRHVLDEVEEDIVNYTEMSNISRQEWEERHGGTADSHAAQRDTVTGLLL
ncbi:hypothetical protein KEM55_007430 [Ascosphaera atra]|nr:hypothetical protein KEM55_007430 [Ascosphaera atra]